MMAALSGHLCLRRANGGLFCKLEIVRAGEVPGILLCRCKVADSIVLEVHDQVPVGISTFTPTTSVEWLLNAHLPPCFEHELRCTYSCLCDRAYQCLGDIMTTVLPLNLARLSGFCSGCEVSLAMHLTTHFLAVWLAFPACIPCCLFVSGT